MTFKSLFPLPLGKWREHQTSSTASSGRLSLAVKNVMYATPHRDTHVVHPVHRSVTTRVVLVVELWGRGYDDQNIMAKTTPS